MFRSMHVLNRSSACFVRPVTARRVNGWRARVLCRIVLGMERMDGFFRCGICIGFGSAVLPAVLSWCWMRVLS